MARPLQPGTREGGKQATERDYRICYNLLQPWGIHTAPGGRISPAWNRP
jgi:hypothetical protein